MYPQNLFKDTPFTEHYSKCTPAPVFLPDTLTEAVFYLSIFLTTHRLLSTCALSAIHSDKNVSVTESGANGMLWTLIDVDDDDDEYVRPLLCECQERMREHESTLEFF